MNFLLMNQFFFFKSRFLEKNVLDLLIYCLLLGLSAEIVIICSTLYWEQLDGTLHYMSKQQYQNIDFHFFWLWSEFIFLIELCLLTTILTLFSHGASKSFSFSFLFAHTLLLIILISLPFEPWTVESSVTFHLVSDFLTFIVLFRCLPWIS